MIRIRTPPNVRQAKDHFGTMMTVASTRNLFMPSYHSSDCTTLLSALTSLLAVILRSSPVFPAYVDPDLIQGAPADKVDDEGEGGVWGKGFDGHGADLGGFEGVSTLDGFQ